MSKFFPLEVTHIDRTTKDSVVVSLKPMNGLEDKFAFKAGQYLTFKTHIDDTELRRSYSICSSVNDPCLRVGIKRVTGGGFSTWANDELEVGDIMEAMSPMGNFTSEPNKNAHSHYLAFVAGSGITPVLGLIKTILEEEPHSMVSLIYGNRNVASIMFREELEDLKNSYMLRFSLHNVLSCGSDIEFLSGRIDKEKCRRIFDGMVNPSDVETIFICGPEEMTQMLKEELQGFGIENNKIKYELFGTSQVGRLAMKARQLDDSLQKQNCDLTIIKDGVSHKVSLAGSQTSVLTAALDAKIDAPFACQAGVCSTCRARVIDGEYDFVTNHALEDYEVEQGFVLTCQCYPTSDKVVVEYDT